MIVEGYVLHLYCDAKPSHEHEYKSRCSGRAWEYGGIDKARAWREGRREGWVKHRDGTVTCPECNPRAAQRGREE